MIDKWFIQDLNSILDKKDRAVVICEDDNGLFFRDLIPAKFKVFEAETVLDELEVKYVIEKNHRDDKVVVFTAIPKDKLKFTREYCETGGCIEIKKAHNYISEKIFKKLNKNIQLLQEELITAAKVSIGKDDEYWLDIINKGSDRIFDIEREILPFLNDPKKYCKKLDKDVKKQFFEKVNAWLERDFIKQPPETLAKEVADNILDSLLKSDTSKKFLLVYHSWADSNKYKSSLSEYVNSLPVNITAIDIWDVHIDHPFVEIDHKWLAEISANLQSKVFIEDKLDLIKKRNRSFIASHELDFKWGDVLTILEFDERGIQTISDFNQAVDYYTKHFYKLDSAIRHLYTNFLNDKSIIKPFQEKYESILIQFLDKWFSYFNAYKENQTGLVEEILNSSQGKTAIIVGDGISYEISQNVISKIGSKFEVENNFRFGGFPSDTMHNMSRLYLADGRTEELHKKREEFLTSKFGADISFSSLEDVSYAGDTTRFLLTSCKDIDSIGEKMQQKALKFIDSIEDMIADKSEQLLNIGYDNVYIISDHGFVLTGLLAESDKVEVNFNGNISKSERFIRTEQKQTNLPNLIEIKQRCGDFNFLYFSKTNRPFKTPGVYGYSHGGISPQELIIPFVKISKGGSSIQALTVTISNKEELKSVVGDIFKIDLKAESSEGELFSSDRKVLILFMEEGKQFNTSDIITVDSNSIVKKEYHFDGKKQIEIILIDAVTKETIDRAVVKKDDSRNLDGLL